MEEEKKEIRITLSTVLVILLIFFAIMTIMGITIYKLINDKAAEINDDKLQVPIQNLWDNTPVEEKNTSNELKNQVQDLDENTWIESNEAETSYISEDLSKSNIFLYYGCEFKPQVGVQYPSEMKNTDEAKKKYNTTYYNYAMGKYEGVTNGEFGEETYEGYSVVSNVKRIAMTQKYDAIPRKFTRISELPKELDDMTDCTSVDVDSVDLDNDGKEEKIVCWKIYYSNGQIGDGEPQQASSGIILFDSNYKKIADLVTLDEGFWGGVKGEATKVFLSLDDVEYIDIDNDGIMEIIISVPTYHNNDISILKYSNGNIEGEINLKASVMP